MLECKYFITSSSHFRIFELIDTCWNVNKLDECIISVADKELIDTCWNVNVDFKANISFSGGELIDTCWNVNQERTEAKVQATGINRYMLECKLYLSQTTSYLLR